MLSIILILILKYSPLQLFVLKIVTLASNDNRV